MARRLTSFVHVAGRVYGPDDDVPKDVVELITNPNAWGEGEAAEGSSDELDINASIQKVLDYVGDDPARAGEALEAEQAKGEDARSTLVEKLQAIAGNGE